MIRLIVPLSACVVLMAGGACVWRPQAKVQTDVMPSIQDLRVRAVAAEVLVRTASNRVDLAGRAIENAVSVRGDVESIFLSALLARDAGAVDLAVTRVEVSSSEAVDAFRLASRLVHGSQRIASSGEALRSAMRDAEEYASMSTVPRDVRERLRRAVLDVEDVVREVDAVADEIKVRWLLRQGPPDSSNRSAPVGSVKRDLAGKRVQTIGE